MPTRPELITALRAEYDAWESLLARLTETQILSNTLPANLSIRDVVSHLWAWQGRTLARLDAGLHDHPPQFPPWPDGLRPENSADLDQINAWILATYADKPWSQVYADWRDRYQRVIESGAQLPDSALFDPQRFDWMNGYSLAQVLESTIEHHRIDHREDIESWLREHGIPPANNP